MIKQGCIYGKEIRILVLKKMKKVKNAQKVAKEFDISVSTVRRWVEEDTWLGKRSGIKQKDRDCSKSGRKPAINNLDEFEKLVDENNTCTQEQIAEKYEEKFKKQVTVSQVRVALKKLKITRKKITKQYKESDAQACEKFEKKIKKQNPEKNVYIDESYMRENDSSQYGYAKRGKKVQIKIQGKKRKTRGIIAGLLNNKIITPMCFEGSCHAQTFEYWFENELASKLSPGYNFIMDNASIHNKKRVQKIAKKYNHKVFFYPHTLPTSTR